MKRALVIGSGGLRGAYDAGVIALLGRELGPDYFDAVYASSVGVFAGTFYVANQPDVIENTWRNFVAGNQLVNYLNPLKGRGILDIEYLLEIFSDKRAYLDLDAVINSDTKLVYVLSKYPSGEVIYKTPKKGEIFPLMRAATVMPLFHEPVEFEGDKYIDIGGIIEPLPINEPLSKDFDEVIVVYNKFKGFYGGLKAKLFNSIISTALAHKYHLPFFSIEKIHKNLEQKMEQDPRIRIIRPLRQIPLKSILDTNKERINKTIDIGIEDAISYVKELSKKA